MGTAAVVLGGLVFLAGLTGTLAGVALGFVVIFFGALLVRFFGISRIAIAASSSFIACAEYTASFCMLGMEVWQAVKPKFKYPA